MAKSYFFIGLLLWVLALLGFTGDRIPVTNDPVKPDSVIIVVTGDPPVVTDSSFFDEPVPDVVPVSKRDLVIQIARSQIGVRQTGDNTGPEVDMYLRSVGIEPPAFWCAAFIGWVHIQASVDIPRSAAWSPSWFPASRLIENDMAEHGDVGGIYFRSLGRIAHVFLYDEQPSRNSNFVHTIEGNTNDDGSRNGHSVLRKKRSKNQIHRSSSWI